MAIDWFQKTISIWHIWGKDLLFSAMFKHGNTALKVLVGNCTFTSYVYKQNMWVTLFNKRINKHEERCQDYGLVYNPALVPFYFNTPVRALSAVTVKFPLKHVKLSAEEKHRRKGVAWSEHQDSKTHVTTSEFHTVFYSRGRPPCQKQRPHSLKWEKKSDENNIQSEREDAKF